MDPEAAEEAVFSKLQVEPSDLAELTTDPTLRAAEAVAPADYHIKTAQILMTDRCGSYVLVFWPSSHDTLNSYLQSIRSGMSCRNHLPTLGMRT